MDFEKCDINSKVLNSMQFIICLWDFKGVSWVGSRIIWTKVRTHLSFMGKKLKLYIINGEGKRGSWYHKICHYNWNIIWMPMNLWENSIE